MRAISTLSLIAFAGVLAAAPAAAADDNSRGVNIIDAAPTQEAAPAAAPATAPKPADTRKNPSAGTPSYNMMSIEARPVDIGAPQAPATADPARPRELVLGAIPLDPKVGNTAAVSLDLLPALEVPIGSKVSFRVTTKKPGYLILVDVDATGKLTQIYPATGFLTAESRAKRDANYLRPGKPMTIPSMGDAYANVEYVATPPAGVAMIVAILSDQPVQIIDLPDLPAKLAGQAEALTYLANLAKELRIPRGGNGALQEAHWSFDAKFYAIR